MGWIKIAKKKQRREFDMNKKKANWKLEEEE